MIDDCMLESLNDSLVQQDGLLCDEAFTCTEMSYA